jgi:DNA topoisomerase-2
MNLFDENEKLRRYETVYDIARAFFPVRREIYERRRSAMLAKLLSELEVLSNRAKYIQEQLDDTLDLRRQKRESINALLASRGYAVRDGGYDYLLKMPQDGVTEEKVTALMSDRDGKQREYAELMETSASALWIRDLDALDSAYSVIVERKRWEEDSVSKGDSVGCSIKVKRTMVIKKIGLNSVKNKM